jgi:hypothetical protein
MGLIDLKVAAAYLCAAIINHLECARGPDGSIVASAKYVGHVG